MAGMAGLHSGSEFGGRRRVVPIGRKRRNKTLNPTRRQLARPLLGGLLAGNLLQGVYFDPKKSIFGSNKFKRSATYRPWKSTSKWVNNLSLTEIAVCSVSPPGMSRGREPGKKFASKKGHSTRRGKKKRRRRNGKKGRKEGAKSAKSAMIPFAPEASLSVDGTEINL